MSNPTSSKRPRGSSPSLPSSPPTFSDFFNDPEADLLLLTPTYSSLDEQPKPTVFAIRRLFLQAMSPIFDDALRMAHPSSQEGGGGGGRETASFDGQAAPGKLELMRLDEEGSTLENALRLSHRELGTEAKEEVLTLGWKSQITMRSLLSLVLILFARKYETPLLVELAADSLNDHLLGLCYINALGIAIVAKHPPLARRAFAAWDAAFKNEVEDALVRDAVDPSEWLQDSLQTMVGGGVEQVAIGYTQYVPGKVFVGWRPERVSDMKEELLEAIPFKTLLALLQVETEVLHTIGATWTREGCDFIRDHVTK